jgi:protein-S-isoprenylcysteine O-methyltransferase Ste14
MEKLGHFLFKYRNLLFPLIIISLVIFFQPHLALGDIRWDIFFDILGIIIMLSGLALRAIVIGYVYIRRGGVNKQVYADKLVTEGIFSLCRNPLYVGNILMVLGFLLIFHNPWTYILGTTVPLLAYKAIVTAEESFLLKKFGAEYQAYCDNVPRWSFRLGDVRKNLADYRFSWSRVLLKDYTTAYATVITILGILLYERVALQEYINSTGDFRILGATFILASIAFVVVYILKKRRILTKHDLATTK